MARCSVLSRFGTTAKRGNSRWMSASRSCVAHRSSGLGRRGASSVSSCGRDGGRAAALEQAARRRREAGVDEGACEGAARRLHAVDRGDEQGAQRRRDRRATASARARTRAASDRAGSSARKEREEGVVAAAEPAEEGSPSWRTTSAPAARCGRRVARRTRATRAARPRRSPDRSRRGRGASASSRGVASRAQALVGPGERELRAAAPLDEVAAPHAALVLQRLEHVVDGGEAAGDALGVRRLARDDAVAIEQRRARGPRGGRCRAGVAPARQRAATSVPRSRRDRCAARARGAGAAAADALAGEGARAAAERLERVVGDLAGPDHLPERRRAPRSGSPRRRARGRRRRRAPRRASSSRIGRGDGPSTGVARPREERLVLGEVERDAPVVRAERLDAGPDDLARRAERVEVPASGSPSMRAGRISASSADATSGQPSSSPTTASSASRPRRLRGMPCHSGRKRASARGVDRLDRPAQPGERLAAEGVEDLAVAELGRRAPGRNAPSTRRPSRDAGRRPPARRRSRRRRSVRRRRRRRRARACARSARRGRASAPSAGSRQRGGRRRGEASRRARRGASPRPRRPTRRSSPATRTDDDVAASARARAPTPTRSRRGAQRARSSSSERSPTASSRSCTPSACVAGRGQALERRARAPRSPRRRGAGAARPRRGARAAARGRS